MNCTVSDRRKRWIRGCCGLGLAMTMVAGAAQGQGFFDNSAIYGGLGYAETSLDDDGLFDGLEQRDDDQGLHVFGGYRFNQYVAAELSIRDLGKYRASGDGFDYRAELLATTIGVVGTLPLGNWVSLYARLGVGSVSLDERLITSNYRYKDDDNGGVSSLGAGIEFRPMGGDRLAIRLGWESHFFTIETERFIRIGNTAVLIEDDYDQRVDNYGLDIAWYFSL